MESLTSAGSLQDHRSASLHFPPLLGLVGNGGNRAAPRFPETGNGGKPREWSNLQKDARKDLPLGEFLTTMLRKCFGRRTGEDHQNAVLTDEEVQAMRDLRDQGSTYEWLAEKFEVSKSSVAKICKYQRR